MQKNQKAAKADVAQLTADDGIAIWRARDAAMASNLIRESKSLKAPNKILAVCGNIHARVANDGKDPIVGSSRRGYHFSSQAGHQAVIIGSCS